VAHFGQVREGAAREGEAPAEPPVRVGCKKCAPMGTAHPTKTDGTRSVPATLGPIIVPSDGQSAALSPLPVVALRLPDKILDTLRELGIRQIGQLQQLPRSSLPARFGPCVL